MRETIVALLIAAISTLGFSILFYVHPRRLFLATLGGVLTWGTYLLVAHFLDGILLPNLLAALVGAGYSEICARLTRVPVPVYMVPAVITLLPGSKLYATMFSLVAAEYVAAAQAALAALQISLGIAGGIMAASAVSIFLKSRRQRVVTRPPSSATMPTFDGDKSLDDTPVAPESPADVALKENLPEDTPPLA